MRTGASLALVTAYYENGKKDYLDIFVPFIATLIDDKMYKRVSTETICRDFADFFGFNVPHHPMSALLNRCCKKYKLIAADHGEYIPRMEEVKKHSFSDRLETSNNRYNILLNSFKEYAIVHHDTNYSLDESNDIIISYLNVVDVQYISASFEEAPALSYLHALPKNKRSARYIVGSFILNELTSNSDSSDIFLDLSVGNLTAASIFLGDIKRFSGQLNSLAIYLDTKFIFRLIGIEGEYWETVYKQLMGDINQSGAKSNVFSHIYDEMFNIIESARPFINNIAIYDVSRASMATKYFIENDYTTSSLDQLLVQFETILANFNISIIESPSHDKNREHVPDEKWLIAYICEKYELEPEDMIGTQKNSILNDVRSLSSIYLLRKGKKTSSIKQAKHLFVTTNKVLARTSQQYEKQVENNGGIIPTCTTDIFLGTIIWLQKPIQTTKSIQKRKLIAQCQAAISADEILLKTFLSVLGKQKDSGKITEEEYLLLRTSRTIHDHLAETTRLDPEQITEQTTAELLDRIRSKEHAKFVSEHKRRLKEEEKHEVVQDRINVLADKVARAISWFVPIAILGLAIGAQFISVISNPILKWSLSTLFTVITVLWSINVKSMRQKSIESVRSGVINYFSGK
jgi:hypothetical protein